MVMDISMNFLFWFAYLNYNYIDNLDLFIMIVFYYVVIARIFNYDSFYAKMNYAYIAYYSLLLLFISYSYKLL